jgi:hypothetical protein
MASRKTHADTISIERATMKSPTLRLLILFLLFGTVGADADPITIDAMRTNTFGGYWQNYRADKGIIIVGQADFYDLNNGTSWEAGAGSHPYAYSLFDREVVQGSTIYYLFRPPGNNVVFQNTDYNAGNHSAQGVLVGASPLVLKATIGETSAQMEGYARILSNEATWYGEPRFNFYSAPVGSVVPFSVNYHLLNNQTWQPGMFTSSFNYNLAGHVQFIAVVPEPACFSFVMVAAIVMFWAHRRRVGRGRYRTDVPLRSNCLT